MFFKEVGKEGSHIKNEGKDVCLDCTKCYFKCSLVIWDHDINVQLRYYSSKLRFLLKVYFPQADALYKENKWSLPKQKLVRKNITSLI